MLLVRLVGYGVQYTIFGHGRWLLPSRAPAGYLLYSSASRPSLGIWFVSRSSAPAPPSILIWLLTSKTSFFRHPYYEGMYSNGVFDESTNMKRREKINSA